MNLPSTLNSGSSVENYVSFFFFTLFLENNNKKNIFFVRNSNSKRTPFPNS